MASRVMLHLLSYNCNMYTGIEDHLKTLNVHEIWNVLCLCLCVYVYIMFLCYVCVMFVLR